MAAAAAAVVLVGFSVTITCLNFRHMYVIEQFLSHLSRNCAFPFFVARATLSALSQRTAVMHGCKARLRQLKQEVREFCALSFDEVRERTSRLV